MKNTKLTFRMTALLFMLASQISFAKDVPQGHRSQLISTSESEYNQEPEFSSLELEKIRLLQEEMFDGIKDQANTIMYSLQQVEQVLIANKIKFDETKISKKELLQEIKGIKAVIEKQYSQLQNLPSSEGIFNYVITNKGFMDYLLICMQKDATMFNSDKFDAFLADMENPESAWFKNLNLKTNEDFNNLIITNETSCTTLIEETENFGLSPFNKAFRYFQDKPILFGQTSMSLVGYSAAALGTAVLACAIASYVQTTTPYRDVTKPLQGPMDIDINGRIFHHTYENNDKKSYVEMFQDFIGRRTDTLTAQQNMNHSTEDSIIAARKDFGLFNYIHSGVANFQGEFVGPIVTFLALQGKPIYNWTTEKSAIAYKKTINYLRGEIDKTANSMFESETQKVYFHDMIGAEHLEKLAQEFADYIKHPRRYESSGITPEKGILLTGPAQTGKSFFAQALQTLINDEADQNGEKVKFMYVTQDLVWGASYDGETGLNAVFKYARNNAPFILFIDEVDMIGARRDKDGKTTNDLMTNMSGLSNDKGKKVMVIAATNRPEELDFALLQDGRFGTQIRFEKPTYEHRKQHLMKTVAKRNITTLSAEYIDSIAQETEGSTFNTLDKIIINALKFAMQQSRLVTAQDFEDSLDYNFRQIRTNIAMSAKEKETVAIYHAGQAAARHLLSTIQEVVKVTIHAVDKPVKGKEGFALETNNAANKGQNADHIQDERIRSIKLGNVFTLSISNNLELISDKDQEDELLALLAGQAALELVKGQCYNNFGKEDRAKILHVLETKISQSGPVTDAIRLQALAEKDVLTKKIKAILAPHIKLIKTITDALLHHNTIDKYEWATIIKNYKN